MTQKTAGFSLLELMVVLVIIGILLSIAIPTYIVPLATEQVAESVELVEKLKPRVSNYYEVNGAMPASFEDAGLPPAEKLLGNYVKRIEFRRGAFHVHFGNKAVPLLQDKILSVRAITVSGSPTSPMSWVCGYSKVPDGMVAGDPDFSTVPAKYLNVKCRDSSRK